MIDFEKWFADQDFYTNMRFIHGDALFAKDGDVYRVLPVQMTYVAWSEKHAEYAELRQVSVALNTETINQRRYIVSKQSEIEKLKAENVRLSGLLKEQKRCFDECSQMASDLIKERDQLTEEFEEDKRFLKEAIQSKDTQIEKHKHIQKSDEMLIASQKKRVDQLKAEKAGLGEAIDDEIKRCLHSVDAPIRDEHDKGWRNAMLSVVSSFKKLRGGDQNTKNSIQVIESNANRGGDQNGEH